MPVSPRLIAICSLIAVAVAAPGCGSRIQQRLGPSTSPPVVHLESAPLAAGDAGTSSVVLTWTAASPSGRVDHYLVTTDVRAVSRESDGWTATTARTRTLQLRSAVRGGARLAATTEPEFDLFAVRAVDDRGAVSKPAYRAFFAQDIAPTVQIVSPVPSALIMPVLPPAFTIRWQGSDPDGPDGLPAKYKYKLFRLGPDIPYIAWLVDPDSLRRTYAPTFAGWDSIGGDSTQVRYTNLLPTAQYLFVITALDAEGAYDPVFSLNKNMLRFSVAEGSLLGPLLTLFNSTFSYTYMTGGFLPDSQQVIHMEAPAGEPFTLNWHAMPPTGSSLSGYRWALDIADVHDETPRQNKNDLSHWSAWSLATTSATVGPFHGPTLDVPHRLYVEAGAADNDMVSLGVVEFRLVQSTFDKDLLIVDDTRLRPDMRSGVSNPSSPDSLRAPGGTWPSAAELDTFLYAVGGVRWRMTPTGTSSPAGVFKGYRFDTLGTRRGLADPTIPLEVLGRYRHIIWMVDPQGSLNYPDYNGGSPINPVNQMTTLQYMTWSNRQNTLAEWVQAGGRLWALGGGVGNATNVLWNYLGNDTPDRTYSSLGPRPDLGPGRFMYDISHWQSEFKIRSYPQLSIGRAPFPVGGRDDAAGYALLPATLRRKSAGTDPIWPYRTPGDFYQPLIWPTIEWLSKPNAVLEDRNPSAQRQDEVQVLDTLMVATAPALPPQGSDPAVDRIVNPVMTYYYGPDCGPVVFSGFDIWTWTRADCVQLVDAVLGGIWGLTRSASASGVTAGGAPAAGRTRR